MVARLDMTQDNGSTYSYLLRIFDDHYSKHSKLRVGLLNEEYASGQKEASVL